MLEIDPELPCSPSRILRVKMDPPTILLVDDGVRPRIALRMQLHLTIRTHIVSAALKTTLLTMPLTLGQK